MRPPRGLSDAEAAAWAQLAATVKPLEGQRMPLAERSTPGRPLVATPPASPAPKPKQARPAPVSVLRPPARPRPAAPDPGLDSHWDRKLKAGTIAPDFTLDLHGHTLDSAHARLDSGLAQAKAMGARLVLLVAGKPRPVEAADRAERRGAIRAKILDWLAAGPHGSDVAAIRKAHRRHGGEGALYIVLKRRR